MAVCEICGHDTKKRWQDRSVEQHRRFRGLVPLAFAHWNPEDFKPENSEHLRKWLLVASGWCHTKTVRFKTANPEVIQAAAMVLEAFLRDFEDERIFIDIDLEEKTLTGKKAKSTRFPKSKADTSGMHHDQACQIYSVCEEIICANIGIEDCGELFLENDGAAKLI